MPTTTGAHRDPIELVRRAKINDTVAWACGKCGTVFAIGSLTEPGEDTSKRDAIQHCAEMICECGQPVEEWRTACKACITKHEAEKTQAVFDKAKKIPWKEYDGEHVYYEKGDAYYPDVQQMLDDEEDIGADDPWPTWAWACNPVGLSFRAGDIAFGQLEHDEHHEDAGSAFNEKNLEELQELLDEWSDARGIVSYHPDYTRVVMCEDLVAERRAELDGALSEGDELGQEEE